MSQKAQLLYKVAQAAARDALPPAAALPQFAYDVWERVPAVAHTKNHFYLPPFTGTLPFTPGLPDAELQGANNMPLALLGQNEWSLEFPRLRSHGLGGHGSLGHVQPALPAPWGPVVRENQLSGLARPWPVIASSPIPAPCDTGEQALLLGVASHLSGITLPGGHLIPPQSVPTAASEACHYKKAHYNQSVMLNKQIMQCRSTDELCNLVKTRGKQFDFFNISSAISKVPKLLGPNVCASQLDPATKCVVDYLATLMAENISHFDARGLANAAWAFGKLKYVPSHSLPGLIAEAAVQKIESFSPQNLSNLLWSFVYMHYRNDLLLKKASEQVRGKVNLFKPQELANIIWAFASLDFYDSELMNAMACQSVEIVGQFKEQELSNIIWAFGKLKHYDRELFNHLLTEAVQKLPHFLPQGISNMAWSLATVGHHDVHLFELLASTSVGTLANFDIQALSNMAWAMATVGYKHTPFMNALVMEAMKRIDRMSSQNLSNLLWSCATLGHYDYRMLATWADYTLLKLDSFEPQGLSNTVWAFAKLGYLNPDLLQILGRAVLNRIESFTPQGLSNTAWAFAVAGHCHTQLLNAISRQTTQHMRGFNAQNCSVTLWAFASLRHYDKGLYDAILETLASEIATCEPQNIANTLWAFARMNHPLGEHAPLLVQHCQRLMPLMNQQELCNSMWALAVLDLLEAPLFTTFCELLGQVNGLTAEGLHQAYHAQLMFHSNIAKRGGTNYLLAKQEAPTLPEPLHSHAQHLWATSAMDVHISRFQQEVSNALLSVGVNSAMEWLTDDGLFSIDIAFEVDGQKIAIEVDGCHHYSSNSPYWPLSDMAIRRQFLKDRGWRVINIGFQEWELMGSTLEQRGARLLRLVSQELGTEVWSYVHLPTRKTASVLGDWSDFFGPQLLLRQPVGPALSQHSSPSSANSTKSAKDDTINLADHLGSLDITSAPLKCDLSSLLPGVCMFPDLLGVVGEDQTSDMSAPMVVVSGVEDILASST